MTLCIGLVSFFLVLFTNERSRFHIHIPFYHIVCILSAFKQQFDRNVCTDHRGIETIISGACHVLFTTTLHVHTHTHFDTILMRKLFGRITTDILLCAKAICKARIDPICHCRASALPAPRTRLVNCTTQILSNYV